MTTIILSQGDDGVVATGTAADGVAHHFRTSHDFFISHQWNNENLKLAISWCMKLPLTSYY